jgi:glucose-specific phosphotransferase system IIA component
MKYFHKAFSVLQKIGQSLMIPVSVLPAAGLLVALGRVLKDQPESAMMLKTVGEVMYSGGLAIFEQLPAVFAMGVAIGFAQGAGVAALSAGVGYFTLVNVLKVVSGLNPAAPAINTGVFGGILIGAMTASIFNRFHKTQLPPILGFFSGKRLVPILTAASAIFVGLALGVLWPPVQDGIRSFGVAVMNSLYGPALYAAGKRMLIPMGLHHVFYQPFLFEFGEYVNAAGQIFKGDSVRYFAGDINAGKIMASEFPLMLFGLPMAAFAMYLRARPEHRKAVGGMMLSAALTSIITGITEPIEFAFIFVAPVLYVLHVTLAFVSGALTSFFNIHLGYTFSASLIDLGVGYFNQTNMSLLLIVGPIIGLIYFGTFYSLIGWMNLKTPGREVKLEEDDSATATANGAAASSKNLTTKAGRVLELLGGASNIAELDACITRLRLTLKDPSIVDKNQFKSLGAAGVMQSGPNMQIIFGVESDQLKEEIKGIIAKGPAVAAAPAAKEVLLMSPIEGKIVDISQVPDETFAGKILGDGFAIDPTSGLVKAPCDAEVMHLFPTGHAIALKTNDDLEVLIHIGIDTVKMKGEGFKALVKTGDKVVKGQNLIEFDVELVKNTAKSVLTPVVVTNMDVVSTMKVQQTPKGAVLNVQLKS